MTRTNSRNIGVCRDCGHRQNVWRREWLRAKSPRCVACGGVLEPCKAAKKKLAHAQVEHDRAHQIQKDKTNSL